MPAVMRESQLEAKVVRFCRAHGLYCRKFSSPSNAGVPDRVIVGPKGVLFLELKRPGNKPTALQLREIQAICTAGGKAAWADTFEKAEATIRFCCLGTQTGMKLSPQAAFELTKAVVDTAQIAPSALI